MSSIALFFLKTSIMKNLAALANIALIIIAFVAIVEFFQRRKLIADAKKKCSCTGHSNTNTDTSDTQPTAQTAPYTL